MNVTLIDTLAEISDSLFLMFSDSTPLTVDASPCGNVRNFKSFGFDSKEYSKKVLWCI